MQTYSKNLPQFSVVIVSWNVADSLAQCLSSIQSTRYPNLEVIVVDNASEDQSGALVKTKYPSVKLIESQSNLGFPKALNIGLKNSSGDYLLALNPDVQVPSDFFMDLVQFFNSNTDAAIMGPKFENEGSVFVEPGVINTLKTYWTHSLKSKYTPDTSIPITVNSISGACMVISRGAYQRIGDFTESVFMYFEDLDYCRRARSLNLPIYFNPTITVIHKHGTSSKKTSQESYKYLWESVIYPLRKLTNVKNFTPSSRRYHNEASIWYNGWPKHLLITIIIWLANRLKSSSNQ